eukprot:TRINITY_DN17114_c0_g1_i1.p1 TRINITY_DN17114_c0_g1~~TRINITY_DN17114_c0_g1_i1.p1  ORF type:complete len:293 (-),score=9.58 TRINITY_DN17114_c0_g1_i1:383-1147(-)
MDAKQILVPSWDAHRIAYWVQDCRTSSPCSIAGVNLQEHKDTAVGQWAEYSIWDPIKNAEICPKIFKRLCGLMVELQHIGLRMTRMAITEVYPPQTRIPKHHSVQQGRLRLLCPIYAPAGSRSRLIFPGSGKVEYSKAQEGKCSWFDESFEHELLYEGSASRSSLIIDVPHPSLLLNSFEPVLGEPGPPPWNYLSRIVEELAVDAGLGAGISQKSRFRVGTSTCTREIACESQAIRADDERRSRLSCGGEAARQ